MNQLVIFETAMASETSEFCYAELNLLKAMSDSKDKFSVLGWAFSQGWENNYRVLAPSRFCETLILEARERKLFDLEALDTAAGHVARIGAERFEIGRGNFILQPENSSPQLSPEQKRSLEPLIFAVAQSILAKRQHLSDLEPKKIVQQIFAQLENQAELLSFAQKVSPLPDSTSLAIAREFRQSVSPWKILLIPFGMPASVLLEPPTLSSPSAKQSAWTQWGEHFLKELGEAEARENNYWAERSEQERSRAKFAKKTAPIFDAMKKIGLPGFFNAPPGQTASESLFATALRVPAAKGRDLALEIALQSPPAALSKALADPAIFAALFFLDSQSPCSPDEDDMESLLSFARRAKSKKAFPAEIPALPLDATPLSEIFADTDRSLACELFHSLGGKLPAPCAADIAKCYSPEALRLAISLGGEPLLEEAVSIWAREHAFDSRSGIQPIERSNKGLPEFIDALGKSAAISSETRQKLWLSTLLAGNPDAALSLSMSPPATADSARLLDISDAITALSKGFSGKAREAIDERCAKMMDALVDSSAFRDALSGAFGKKGMSHFSSFCRDYSRIADKFKETENRDARLSRIEALRFSAKLSPAPITAKGSKSRRSL